MAARHFRFWPKSLYGQILLVAASALLIAQSVNAALLLSGVRSRAVAETSVMVVGRVANQIERQGTDAFDPANSQRRTERERFKSPRAGRRSGIVAITLSASPLNIPRADYQSDMSVRAQEFLRQGDIELSDVRISAVSVNALPPELRDPQLRRWRTTGFRQANRETPHRAVLFSARLPDGRWLNAAGLVRPNENASIFALLLQTFTLFAAVMIPLALVARRIARPLDDLTKRVRQVGIAGEPQPMERAGPEDVQQLIVAFNAMQARVSNLLGEKDVMLGAIGHDLKTPLAALRVRIESVEDDDEREKMASTIDEMVTILDDILTLARLGKSGEPVQSVDIGAMIETVTSDFAAAQLTPPDRRHVADVRPVLIRRALRNLIGNAIAYGNRALLTVREENGMIFVDIDDEGPGIDPALAESMFEPFTRAERSRSRSTGGSGLGLTISRAIARAHGGDVRLENRTAGGLRATISFKQ
ncbi:ATP-binding protein [Sphingorhabdus sp.]|uniref:sensor histidine kinase n=1 Tax=Sphingorhabdus sp. TaxID=1902408 RepID=UPI00391CC0B2